MSIPRIMAADTNEPSLVEKAEYNHRGVFCRGLCIASAAGSFRPKHPQAMLETAEASS